MNGRTGLARGLLPIVLLIGCSAGPGTSEAQGVLAPESRVDPCSVAELLTVDSLMGRYEISSVRRYRGGLMTAAEAEDRLGEVMELAPSEFRYRGERVLVPAYEIVCQDDVPIEGEVPGYEARSRSSFWGVASEREVIWELTVRDGAGERLAGFEVVPGSGAPEIWWLGDGWLFVFQQVGRQAAR